MSGGKGPIITQNTNAFSDDMESDKIDEEFNIEDERSNPSRQASFFTRKRQEIELRNTPQKHNK
jgi:hypothetical protein